MTLATSRQAIADAANAAAIEGITAHPYYVQDTTAGTTYVRLDTINYPNQFGGVVTWNVVTILPQDTAHAERFLEEKVPALRDAVAAELAITEIAPQRLQIDGVGVVPAVFITGHREEE